MEMNGRVLNEQIDFAAVGRALGIEPVALFQYLQNLIPGGVQEPAAAVAEVEPNLEEDNDQITIVTSVKGEDKAVHRGFLFQKKRQNKDGSKQEWHCDKYKEKNGGCKAGLHTLVKGSVFMKFKPHDVNRSHNHAEDPMAVPLSVLKANIKKRAAPKQLLNNELQSMPLALAPSVSDSAVRKMVRRQRIKNEIPVVETGDVGNIDIPLVAKMYRDGAGREELFVLGDSGKEDSHRILLFGRQSHIRWSEEMDVVFGDGTFDPAPKPFKQIYVILAEQTARVNNSGKWVFPVLYALLMNKSRETYVKLFRMIPELWLAFIPSLFNVDFELAAIQAINEVFPEPEVKIAGCLLHLVKNFKKQIALNGLTVRYRDPEFSVQARMIISLAFVPEAEVGQCFDRLKNHLPAELEPVMNWFKTYYIGTFARPAVFLIPWWSCYERTLAGEDRTNNFAEAANRRLQDALGVDHPTVGRLLQDLKRIQQTHDMHYEQYLAGQVAPKKRRVYFECDARDSGQGHRYGLC
uniref:MULE transposase domain-containing protein n=1 Tax=Ditylenchus dipsaci TaxID=166011 RepID=A0A915EQP4_9BILA